VKRRGGEKKERGDREKHHWKREGEKIIIRKRGGGEIIV
jgi:hypothetical protein